MEVEKAGLMAEWKVDKLVGSLVELTVVLTVSTSVVWMVD